MFVTQFACSFPIETILNFKGRSEIKKWAGDICKGTLGIEFEQD